MLQIYTRYVVLIINDKNMGEHYHAGNLIMEESAAQDEEQLYTWNNIQDMKKYARGGFNFYYKKTKRKEKFSFHDWDYTWNFSFRKDKDPDLTIVLKYTYEKTQTSIKNILNYYNSDLAIQYLIEHGMNTIESLR